METKHLEAGFGIGFQLFNLGLTNPVPAVVNPLVLLPDVEYVELRPLCAGVTVELRHLKLSNLKKDLIFFIN